MPSVYRTGTHIKVYDNSHKRTKDHITDKGILLLDSYKIDTNVVYLQQCTGNRIKVRRVSKKKVSFTNKRVIDWREIEAQARLFGDTRTYKCVLDCLLRNVALRNMFAQWANTMDNGHTLGWSKHKAQTIEMLLDDIMKKQATPFVKGPGKKPKPARRPISLPYKHIVGPDKNVVIAKIQIQDEGISISATNLFLPHGYYNATCPKCDTRYTPQQRKMAYVYGQKVTCPGCGKTQMVITTKKVKAVLRK